MADLKYTDQHEWVSVDEDVATFGITDFAATQLGDVVFVELPEAGKTLEQFKDAAVVESVKAASEIYAPVSGEVVEVNGALGDEPGLINESPFEKGWMVRVKMSDPSELDKLLDKDQYDKIVEAESD